MELVSKCPAIGVDNVFILLAAWRKTGHSLLMHERMAATFADAGVSITVTSATSALSFGVGCAATFPSVQIFCVYATVAVVFVYVYQMTFFAGLMVVTGRRELAGRHCITFRIVTVESKKERRRRKNKKSLDHDQHVRDNHILARFFHMHYADLLLHPLGRAAVVFIFIVYLVIGAIGCARIQIGLRAVDLMPPGSYGQRALVRLDEEFADYGPVLHVLMQNLSRYESPMALARLIERAIGRKPGFSSQSTGDGGCHRPVDCMRSCTRVPNPS